MRYSKQLDAIVSHAVSQISYKWLPIILDPKLDSSRLDPFSLSISEWEGFIRWRLMQLPSSPWMEVLEKTQMSVVGLATVIFDNLLSVRQGGGQLVDYHHPAYPYLLKHIPDPPLCLTCIGDLSLLDKPKIGLVGSRKASSFAYQQGRSLGRALAERGTVVVSGGAIGCDAAAHLGAFESGVQPAPTIVVFAGGLFKLYPQALQGLFTRLQQSGSLFISERLWNYPSRPMDFPVRNRIIAGLSSYLVLLQAAAKSGALRTASYALDQGREVYALVHEQDDVRALGSTRLLDEGAFPFQSVEDFLSLAFIY